MRVRFSYHKVPCSEALNSHIEDSLASKHDFFGRNSDFEWIIEDDSKSKVVKVNYQAGRFHAHLKGEGDNFYSAASSAMDKLERVVRDHHKKAKAHMHRHVA